jgi:SAM-dependent methyltransferase
MRKCATTAALIDTASASYRAAGRFAYHFARGKLRGDPAFASILALGLLADHARILDLGCGQGLLAAWLAAARACHAAGVWSTDWPPPPRPASYLGIDLRERDVLRARLALGEKAQIVTGDIREVNYPAADAVVILDVLHFMDYGAQERVLARVRAATAHAGALLLRVGDAAGGFRFKMSYWVDRTAALLRDSRLPRLHCRPLSEWRGVLARVGFGSETLPMSAGTPFANFLLIARPQ